MYAICISKTFGSRKFPNFGRDPTGILFRKREGTIGFLQVRYNEIAQKLKLISLFKSYTVVRVLYHKARWSKAKFATVNLNQQIKSYDIVALTYVNCVL